MILAGCSGTGKTTFLNTLFGEELENTLVVSTETQIRERKYELTEGKYKLNLTAVDVPGFGAKMDNQYSWIPIVKYIDHHFMSYLLQEEQPDRSKIKDERVHVCIYFIPPSNTELSPLDIESMKEISSRVNLIPVIARSDTLNKGELANFKRIVNNTLKAYHIEVCKFISDQYVVDKIKATMPYAIVGSNTFHTNSEGKLVRARKYHWGMVEIDNPEHCDFLQLQEVLMSEHMLDLITSTEVHYSEFRQRCLRERLERAAVSLDSDRDDFGEDEVTSKGGIRSYVIYKKASRSAQVSHDLERSEQESRRAFEGIVRIQERRFKEWKAALLVKQAQCNQDLMEDHETINRLVKEVLKFPKGKKILQEIESASGSPLGEEEFSFCYEEESYADDINYAAFRIGLS